MQTTTNPEIQMHDKIVEGLEQGDLLRLVHNEVHIDEYKSKMGRDEDIIVTSFKVRGSEPALDLVNFLEKGYEWVLDADVSSGELSDGDFIVFIESDRTNTYPEQLEELLEDLENLTDYKLSDWRIQFRSDPTEFDFSIDNIKNNLPLNIVSYRQKYGSKELDEMRTAAGLPVETKAPKNDHTQSLRSLAGIL